MNCISDSERNKIMDENIFIITQGGEADGEMGIGSKIGKALTQEIKLSDFTESLNKIADSVFKSMENIINESNRFEMYEIEFKLDVTAGGTIGIASVSGTSGITLKFKKKDLATAER